MSKYEQAKHSYVNNIYMSTYDKAFILKYYTTYMVMYQSSSQETTFIYKQSLWNISNNGHNYRIVTR